jgi:hypothetical protein
MPGPRQSIDDYLKSRIAQLHDLGGVLRQAIVNIVDELGVATLHAWVTLGDADNGLLSVYETVVIGHDGAPHRAKYAYHCEHAGGFLFRYDRDPLQHPKMPHHKHLPPDERRIAADRVTLQDVVDELWPMVVERDTAAAEAELENDPPID